MLKHNEVYLTGLIVRTNKRFMVVTIIYAVHTAVVIPLQVIPDKFVCDRLFPVTNAFYYRTNIAFRYKASVFFSVGVYRHLHGKIIQ